MIVPVETVVVLLSGKQAAWDPVLEFRTSRAASAFSGVRFRVVAVYQRTVEELLAMPGRLWLVLAPIAKDASVKTVQRAVTAVGRRAHNRNELADLLATMSLVAESRGAIGAIQDTPPDPATDAHLALPPHPRANQTSSLVVGGAVRLTRHARRNLMFAATP